MCYRVLSFPITVGKPEYCWNWVSHVDFRTVVTKAFYKHGYSISCTVKEIRGKFGIQLLSYQILQYSSFLEFYDNWIRINLML